jgi:L,D-transpeptidase ErfK/SrfK
MGIYLSIVRYVLCICAFFFTVPPSNACAVGGFRYRLPTASTEPRNWQTVIGYIQRHKVLPKETLLDIAREYGLGFTELQMIYKETDPWIPEVGAWLTIPTQWVLPPTQKQGIVLNLAEMRLYRFFPKTGMVKTYPVGIGDQGWETPEGTYRVIGRQRNPTWVIPESLRAKYGKRQVPPGPDNPLGKYWIGLSRKGYGIHGTNFPWGVGRLVSHGCIRLYPEHIVQLYEEVAVGTPVEIINAPIKIGFRNGDIFLEVHRDPYGNHVNLESYVQKRLQDLQLWKYVAMNKVLGALQEKNGLPLKIGTVRKGGDEAILSDAGER